MERSPTQTGARDKAAHDRGKTNLVRVRCIVPNVHLGDGRVLREGDACPVPRALARRLRAKGMVE